ncbi:MAG: hypothetical protein U1F35_01950 [Steroidobacteraceae bacterium]
MDFQRANSFPWLDAVREEITRLRSADRLPHAILVLAREGLGSDALANWSAAAVLCESSPAPCGACASCVLLAGDNHPDLHRVELEENAQQLKIEQVRDLIGALGLTAYRGGYKVGILHDADRLNAAGANAFLKTLEEPPPRTLLLLLAAPNHRLPATIASRCRRIVLSLPSQDQALSWLGAQGVESGEALARLRLAQGAPLGALAFDPQVVQSVAKEMSQELAQLDANRVDPSLLAERWLRSEPALRIAWLENWITDRIRALSTGTPAIAKTAEPVVLPRSLLKAKIRGLFELLDDTREFKRLAGTSANLQLALEGLLIRHFTQGV